MEVSMLIMVWTITIMTCLLIVIALKSLFKRRVKTKLIVSKPSRYTNTVIIMNMLNDFDSYYSLVSVIMDQARMLSNKDYNVELWVPESANFKKMPELNNILVRRIIPSYKIAEDSYDDGSVVKLSEFLVTELSKYEKAVVIAHDILYLNIYINFAAAIHKVSNLLNNVKWLHGCHSGPSQVRPNNDACKYRYSLPDQKHKIMTFAKCHIDGYSKMYNINRDQVVFVPSARDLRYIFNMTDRVKDFITKQKLYDYDIVQVLPACSTRLCAKGVEKAVRVFAEINKTTKCKFIIVNPNPGSDVAKNKISNIKKIAGELGVGQSVVFASEHVDKFNAVGLSSDELSSLMLYSNVFMFPTIAETGSLVAKEAALNGCLMVLNSDVHSLDEIASEQFGESIMIEWGTDLNTGNDKDTAIRIATLIIEKLKNSMQNKAKRRVLKEYNIEYCGSILNKLVVNEFNNINQGAL